MQCGHVLTVCILFCSATTEPAAGAQRAHLQRATRDDPAHRRVPPVQRHALTLPPTTHPRPIHGDTVLRYLSLPLHLQLRIAVDAERATTSQQCTDNGSQNRERSTDQDVSLPTGPGELPTGLGQLPTGLGSSAEIGSEGRGGSVEGAWAARARCVSACLCLQSRFWSRAYAEEQAPSRLRAPESSGERALSWA